MAYTVLARKWRPENFEELVGQEHVAQTLKNGIQSGKISHGYLFTGTRGVGKTTSARILTKALNCEQGPTATPCGLCKNCKEISSGVSMDVLEIDGASNRGVDDIRELREQVKYAPMQSKYKVYIVDEVHMLTREAFNALLKTLEEPPANVVFIFATTEIRKVPDTIVSRVQRFDFKRISDSKIKERLQLICEKEKINAQEDALHLLAVRADGSMRDALSLFDQVFAFSGSSLTNQDVRQVLGIPPEELYDKLLSAMVNHNKAGCIKTLDEFYDLGVDIPEILRYFGEYLRNLLYLNQPDLSPQFLGISDSRIQAMTKAKADLNDGDILRFGKMISNMLQELRNSPNVRLILEMGIARMASLDRVVDLQQILNILPASLEEEKKNK